MINHPEVEVYYEREDGEEYLSENYDVFVDEDCMTCHESFLPQKHFAPMIPAHGLNANWNDLPWWLDTKYLMFFSDIDDSSSGSSGYQHTISQRRNDLPPPQQGGYIPASGGSSVSSSGSAATIQPSQSSENPHSRTKSGISGQNSGGSSRSSESSSKRKFRKRK